MYAWVLQTEEDKAVFNKLYEQYQQPFYHIAFKILHNEFDAEDAVHNAFVKMALNFYRYRLKPYNSLVKICRAIVRHEAFNILRDYKKHAVFTSTWDEEKVEDPSRDILSELIMKYEFDQVTAAIMQLEEWEREFLYLQYVLGLKPKEIGMRLGMTSQKVRSRMMLIRNKVARILLSKGIK